MAEELEMAGVRGELDVIREKDALLEERSTVLQRLSAGCLPIQSRMQKKGDWSGHSVRRI